MVCYSDDGEEYTGLQSGVIISSQISNGSRSFFGNSSVILNFVYNVRELDITHNYDILFRNKTHCFLSNGPKYICNYTVKYYENDSNTGVDPGGP